MLGDFNARVGADRSFWPPCLGHFGIGNMNKNGQCLLELCCHHSLSITNTFFMTKFQHKVSWRHLRSKHWHQLDLVLTRCTNLSNVKLTRSYQSADCDTDHSLVCCNVNIKAKRVHYAKQEGIHRINTCMTRKPEKVKEFIRVLEEALPCPNNTSAAQRWKYLRDTIYQAVSLTFGKKQADSGLV